MIRRVLATGGAQEGYSNQTAGTIEGTQINARILWPANRGTIINPYTEAQAIVQMRRDWPQDIGAARDLSPAMGMAAVTYANFTRETNGRSLSCVAFDVAGPPKLSGYAWRISAFACQPPGKTADLAFLNNVLASIRVGPAGDDKNALGGKLQAFSRS